MKRLALFFSFLLTALLLASCGGVKAPSDDAVIEAYKAASEAASWFTIGTLAVDPAVSAEINGETYNKVVRFDTYDALRSYLLRYFSSELTDTYLTESSYLDYNGALYAMDGARGTDISKGEETYTVLPEKSGKLTLRVVVDLLDYGDDTIENPTGAVVGTTTYDIPYEAVGGQWVFTAFPTIR